MGLKRQIDNRSARIAVVGMGYVGLPLAVEFARERFRVTGIDLSAEKVQAINAGKSYIPDVPTESVAERVAAGKLSAVSNYDVISESDIVCICVPTPLRKTREPDISYVVASTEEIAKRLHKNLLVVLESTTYPGTTDEVVLTKFQATGLRIKKDFFLAFSPERIDPGNKQFGVRNTPKIVGGITPACTDMAHRLYSTIVERVVPVSSAKIAEMVKLLENTFRAVNIGLVNELALICDRLGLNVWEIIDAAATKPFGFMPFYPGPGLGGHCIPVDPLYLSWKMRTLNFVARFIELADTINTSMPDYVTQKIADALNRQEKSVKGSKILVLGLTYKPDVGDLRESPALDIIEHLAAKGAQVWYNDPYVSKITLDGYQGESYAFRKSDLSFFDCAVITTHHSCYDYGEIVEGSQLVIDTRNATKGLPNAEKKIIRL